jgi:hypothetical protein
MSKDDRIQVTLPPMYERIVRAKAVYTGQSKSAVIAEAVKIYVDAIKMDEREKIIKISGV